MFDLNKFRTYLERDISYQTLLLQSWSKNIKKRMVKSPKVHYLDIGVLRAILRKDDINARELENDVIAIPAVQFLT